MGRIGGQYEKGLFDQLMDVQARLEAMEEEHKKDGRELRRLRTEITRIQKEKETLRKELDEVKEKNSELMERNEELTQKLQLIQEDNERMKRILSNNSTNTSLPPSTEQPGKRANRYNGRKQTGKKIGGQPGHPGKHISKAEVEEKIREGIYEHRIEEIGTPGRAYVTRYRLDLEVRTIATEIRIYADENGKFQISDEMKSEVFYGEKVRAISGYLYSEGVVANDRIGDFINSLSGDSLHISTGSIYGFCMEFSEKCAENREIIENNILNGEIICTDATTVTTDGKQTYIRNFSTEKDVLYVSAEKKTLKSMREMRILKGFSGTLVHDHETALYHFGTRHGECNVHIIRYLKKNSEETGNSWSKKMSEFLQGMNRARKKAIENGDTEFSVDSLERYEQRFDEILFLGREENKLTKGKIAKQEEKALLNRLEAYKANHLLFLHDFKVPFSNNMSEKDLRTCKNRQKMAGGFRTGSGRQMYCDIMSFIATIKRRGLNVLHSISSLLNGTPVLN